MGRPMGAHSSCVYSFFGGCIWGGTCVCVCLGGGYSEQADKTKAAAGMQAQRASCRVTPGRGRGLLTPLGSVQTSPPSPYNHSHAHTSQPHPTPCPPIGFRDFTVYFEFLGLNTQPCPPAARCEDPPVPTAPCPAARRPPAQQQCHPWKNPKTLTPPNPHTPTCSPI